VRGDFVSLYGVIEIEAGFVLLEALSVPISVLEGLFVVFKNTELHGASNNGDNRLHIDISQMHHRGRTASIQGWSRPHRPNGLLRIYQHLPGPSILSLQHQ
jgi:hypothetical protein